MTPAESPSDAAKTRRDTRLTSLGKKTIEAPMEVAALAPKTKPMAAPTLPSVTMVDMKENESIEIYEHLSFVIVLADCGEVGINNLAGSDRS